MPGSPVQDGNDPWFVVFRLMGKEDLHRATGLCNVAVVLAANLHWQMQAFICVCVCVVSRHKVPCLSLDHSVPFFAS